MVHVGGDTPYDVHIGRNIFPRLLEAVAQSRGGGAGGVAIIHPTALTETALVVKDELRRAGYRVLCPPIPNGEACKNADVLAGLWTVLGEFQMGRDGVIIGLGGGSATDLAGFAAATWLRGVPVIQVPTTTLAMVDAAVGGKTGIDSAAGKNMIGAFYPPSAVIEDLDLLSSLPEAELRAGLGEVVKTGFFADTKILDLVKAHPRECLQPTSDVLFEIVQRSVTVKAQVVSEDLKESGLREILNYGHTYAHAIEKFSNYGLRHGEAVAVGCVYAAEVAHAQGRIDAALVALHREAFAAVGLPIEYLPGAGHWDELHNFMLSDKKVRGGKIRMVLLDGLEQPVRVDDLDEQSLYRAHCAVSGEQA